MISPFSGRGGLGSPAHYTESIHLSSPHSEYSSCLVKFCIPLHPTLSLPTDNEFLISLLPLLQLNNIYTSGSSDFVNL